MCTVGQKCDWTDQSYLEPLLKQIEKWRQKDLYEEVCDCVFDMGYDYTYRNIKWWIP